MSGILLFAFFLSLYVLNKKPKTASHWDAHAIIFSLAMSSPVIAILITQVSRASYDFPAYDWASRFMIAIPIFLAMRQLDINALSKMQIGVSIASVASLVIVLVMPVMADGTKTTGNFFNHIHFAHLILALSFLSLLSINRSRVENDWVILLKIGGFIAGLYVAIQTRTRGGWPAIPLVLLLWIYGQQFHNLRRKIIYASSVLMICGVAAYSFTETISERANLIYFDLVGYSNGNVDTSIGIRLQLWKAAIELFLQNPIVGLGVDGFANSMQSMFEQGRLTKAAAEMGNAEVHNEILAKCVSGGMGGLLSILAVYFVPAAIFWNTINSKVAMKKVAAVMGLGLVTGFFVFGLTVEIFNLKMTASFYAFSIAVLAGACLNSDTSSESTRA